MRIVYVHPNRLLTGRAQGVFLFRQCHALAQAGHRVDLLCGRTTFDVREIFRHYGREPVDGLRVVQLGMLRRRHWPRITWNRWFYHNVLRYLRRERDNVDLVYLAEVDLAWYLMHRRPVTDLAVGFEIHNLKDKSWGPGSRLTAREKWVFERATVLWTTTGALAKAVTEMGGLARTVERIPLATDLPTQEPSYRPRDPKHERARVYYVGQLYAMQGVEVAAEALTMLPECELHVVGGKREELEGLRMTARRFGVEERMVLHGRVTPAEVSEKMKDADVLILPSLARGRMPVVAHTKLYEYLSTGRPIVASDLVSIREEVTDGEEAVLVKPGDAGALAAGLKKVVTDTEFARRLARSAYQRALQFTWKRRTERLVELWKRESPAAERGTGGLPTRE